MDDTDNPLLKPIKPMRFEDMSDAQRELLSFNLANDRAIIRQRQLDLAEQARNKIRPAPPLPYKRAFHILQMWIEQTIAFAIMVGLLLMGYLYISVNIGRLEQSANGILAVALTIGIYALYAYRCYVAWNTTVLYSNVNHTGIFRPVNPWLALRGINVKVETMSITTTDKETSWLKDYLKLDISLVTLDTPTDKDKFLHNMSYVQDGDGLIETVEANKAYATA